MSDSLPLVRQWTLLRLLEARRQGMTLRDMAQETGVSQKTITRDLNLLRRVGFPVSETVGDYGRKHWSLNHDRGQPLLAFTLEEAAALYLGRQFLEGLAGTLFWSGAQSAFRKIRAALGEPALRYLQKLTSAVYLHTHALSDYSGRAEMIDQLMVAIEDRRLTVVTYQSLRSTEPVTLYDIHPYALVHYRSALYVIGWSKDHDAIRTFKVDRISAAEVHGLQFEMPADFQPETYLAHSFGIFAGDALPQTVRVRFAPGVVRVLEEKRFHPSQQLTRDRDGHTIAKYQLAHFEEFQSWVLSFGPMAEVLEPDELRQKVSEAARSTLDIYDKNRQLSATPNQQIERPLRRRHQLPGG